MFRIGEFSKLTQVSVRMLRYYDEAGILKPAQIDANTGYRLYSIEQFSDLHKITFLRDVGFNVSAIATALKKWDKDFLADQLRYKQQEIEALIRSEQERVRKIDIAIQDVQQEKIAIHYNVNVKHIPDYKVLSLRKTIPDYFHEGKLWDEIYDFIELEHLIIPPHSQNIAVYHDPDYKDKDVDVEVCVIVDQPGNSQGDFEFRILEQVELMACAMVYGPFENIAAAYEALAHWLTQHNQYRMTGQNRQICHRGPWNEADSDNYLTEIQVPVEKVL